MTVGEPVGLREVRRHSSCHLPTTILTHQATLPGTGWHQLIGLSVGMTSWSWVGFAHSPKTNWIFSQICLSQCQQMKSKAIGAGGKVTAHLHLFTTIQTLKPQGHFHNEVLYNNVYCSKPHAQLWMVMLVSQSITSVERKIFQQLLNGLTLEMHSTQEFRNPDFSDPQTFPLAQP